jgi:hypothetical protein
VNQDIVRAKAIIAELRLNNETAHQLTHTLKNLLTVQRLLLEQIRRTSRRTLEPQASVPRFSTQRITNELDNLAMEVENMKKGKKVVIAINRVRENPRMLLRDHPLMSYKGLRSWPPAWLWMHGEENHHPRGEIGLLREVVLSKIKSSQ